MMKLMRAPNLLIGQHWINVLATAGIACELHNRYLNGALGEIPADQCAPELWLVDERDEMMARKLIEVAAHGPSGETLEAQFTVCWQCGTARNPLDG
jgi:hypothetical protein